MRFEILPKKLFKLTCYTILALLIINLITNVFKHYFYIGNYNDLTFNLLQMFNFDTERNIPTLFSVFLLAFASILLGFIGYVYRQLKQSFMPWTLLSLIFLFLALDETSSFHESLTPFLNGHFEANGLLYFSWVVPYGVITLLIGLSFIKFLASLPTHTNKLFIYSGLIYVSGAIGIEMLSGLYAQQNGDFNMVYTCLYSIEETLEMFGIALFIYALLNYIAKEFEPPTFSITQ